MEAPSQPPQDNGASQPPPPTPEPAKPSAWRTKDFWLGAGGYVMVNGALYGLAVAFPKAATAIGYAALLVNVALLIFLARKRRNAALGMLAAFAVLGVLALCVAPLVALAICFTGGLR